MIYEVHILSKSHYMGFHYLLITLFHGEFLWQALLFPPWVSLTSKSFCCISHRLYFPFLSKLVLLRVIYSFFISLNCIVMRASRVPSWWAGRPTRVWEDLAAASTPRPCLAQIIDHSILAIPKASISSKQGDQSQCVRLGRCGFLVLVSISAQDAAEP